MTQNNSHGIVWSCCIFEQLVRNRKARAPKTGLVSLQFISSRGLSFHSKQRYSRQIELDFLKDRFKTNPISFAHKSDLHSERNQKFLTKLAPNFFVFSTKPLKIERLLSDSIFWKYFFKKQKQFLIVFNQFEVFWE